MEIPDKDIELIDDCMVEVYRTKTPRERLDIAFSLWKSARDKLRAYLKAQHPDWDENDLTKETARRMSHGAV